MSELQIREVARGDAAAVAVLTGELGYPTDADAMARRIEALRECFDQAVFVACMDETVVGWIDVSVVHHLQYEPHAEIGGLVVTNGVRSRGIGRSLVARAEQWAVAHGFSEMLVRSRDTREDAHRFYLREGYLRTKTSAVFMKKIG